MKWYWTPSVSPGRCGLVVAETASARSGKRGRTRSIRVPLPAPEGPVTTKTGLAVEEPNELLPLTVRKAANRLRLADPALVEQPRRLHAAELRHRHEHVEDLRGRDELRRVAQDRLDRGVTGLQVLLQLRALDADVVRSLEGFHPLIER